METILIICSLAWLAVGADLLIAFGKEAHGELREI
jgi:hypothetical protein